MLRKQALADLCEIEDDMGIEDTQEVKFEGSTEFSPDNSMKKI